MITTHVLDTSAGLPAAGVRVLLERQDSPSTWSAVRSAETDEDGRLRTLVDEGTRVPAGVYRLVFDSRSYFQKRGVETFYPSVTVVFEVGHDGHYHVPLLLSPFGYSTYRGS